MSCMQAWRAYTIIEHSPLPKLSCLHTTWASRMSQSSLHTVPQFPFMHTSTRPEYISRPFTSLESPLLQPAKNYVMRTGVKKQQIIGYWIYILVDTSTANWSIFTVCTVFDAHSIVRAFKKVGFSASTKKVVQPDWSSSLSKPSPCWSFKSYKKGAKSGQLKLQ